MIYLDNAATTFPKPASVYSCASAALSRYGANPGRGSYKMADETGDMIYSCRKKAAEFFGAETPDKLIFTSGCTASINCVIKGGVPAGGHVIISDLEHNSVIRPLYALERFGVTVSRAHVYECDPDATVRSFRSALRRSTCLVFCTHVSNVFGVRLPVEAIGGLCREKGIPFGIDAAQSAGVLDTDISKNGASFLCAPAHKGLYGTMGLGLLAINSEALPAPLILGGTGSLSSSRKQPGQLPDRYESGTMNVPGIAALSAGLDFVNYVSIDRIAAHEHMLISALYDGLCRIPGVTLYTQRPDARYHAPLLSFNIGDMPSHKAGELLANRGIAVRTGYHCAYDAHASFGTADRGTIRVCPSAFTVSEDIEALLREVRSIAAG